MSVAVRVLMGGRATVLREVERSSGVRTRVLVPVDWGCGELIRSACLARALIQRTIRVELERIEGVAFRRGQARIPWDAQEEQGFHRGRLRAAIPGFEIVAAGVGERTTESTEGHGVGA